MKAWDKQDSWVIFLALAWLALTMGVRPLALPDEGRYVSVAWEMLTSRNWLYPTLNGLPFFHKPPLFYWITAGSLSLFGIHEWASRLASLLGAGITAFALYAFLLRQKGRTVARLTLLVLATMPFFVAGAQFANLDMLVAGFIGVSIVLAAEAALNANRNQAYRGLLAGAYVASALGVLSKGLIGIVLPGMVIVVWLAWNRRLILLRQLIWLPGLALFALVAVPWFVAMQMRFPDFLHYFFVYQHFQRFTESGFNNPQPFWFYPLVILVLMLPWSWWLPAAAKRPQQEAEDRPSIRSLMWIWVAVIVGFFSIPSSKLVGYILPVLPPLAYLVADGLSRKIGVGEWPRYLKYSVAAAVVVCLSAIVANSLFNSKSDKKLAELIAMQRQPGEPVVFLQNQFFDVPFYLGLREPVKIFDDWNLPPAKQHDNWHKALKDAGKFDPVRAQLLLRDRKQFVNELCTQPVSWVFANIGADRVYPFLKSSLVAAEHKTGLWKVSRTDMAARGLCPEMPIVGSISK
jgi:4-amino-4-deoxy-L-arabinose transferase-like glycosyltransferase